jgi:kanamycin kinase
VSRANVFASESSSAVVIPEVVHQYAAGQTIEPVWINELGGVTFRIGGAAPTAYIKWTPTTSGIDLEAEAARMRWAVRYTAVPRVSSLGRDAAGSWLVTESIDAENAIAARWTAQPRVAAASIGAGLRAMHDAMPIARCPFSWSARARVLTARQRVAAGVVDIPAHSDFAGTNPEAALRELEAVPPEDLVVCHGDACAPNTLLGEDGHWVAHVDLGHLGVADRWADLAIAAWSTVWNYGPGFEQCVYDAYGIVADESKIRYYRLLWELT